MYRLMSIVSPRAQNSLLFTIRQRLHVSWRDNGYAPESGIGKGGDGRGITVSASV